MSDPTDLLARAFAPSEDELLAVEYELPHEEAGSEELAADQRDRYDDQILAALVDPSF